MPVVCGPWKPALMQRWERCVCHQCVLGGGKGQGSKVLPKAETRTSTLCFLNNKFQKTQLKTCRASLRRKGGEPGNLVWGKVMTPAMTLSLIRVSLNRLSDIFEALLFHWGGKKNEDTWIYHSSLVGLSYTEEHWINIYIEIEWDDRSEPRL